MYVPSNNELLEAHLLHWHDAVPLPVMGTSTTCMAYLLMTVLRFRASHLSHAHVDVLIYVPL
jgi:hypothetical protein